MINKVPRIMLVSAMSGGGKTTAVCALLRALNKRGIKTASYKCGPDYIDLMHHRTASGENGINLDMFFYGKDDLKNIFSRYCCNSDIAVTEGVMGYYDGMSMESTSASSYEIAVSLGMPVVLILNARGMAYTTVPIIKSIKEFRDDSGIKAVILNNVTKMTFSMLKPVIERETGVKAVGYIPKMPYCVNSRHLGLELPFENEETERIIASSAEIISETVDIDAILKIAAEAAPIEYVLKDIKKVGNVKIAVAYDKAFCFYYRDNIELLERYGAEIEYFSPLRDKTLPDGIGGVIFGGGYPELYARELSENRTILSDIKNKLGSGMPCLAECGGFMYLHSKMEGSDGVMYSMAGMIDAQAFKTDKLVRFGYVELTADKNTPYLCAGEKIKGHEFHYWDSTDNGGCCTASKPSGKRSWICMHGFDNLFAGFAHLCYGSNTGFVQSFLKRCREYIND